MSGRDPKYDSSFDRRMRALLGSLPISEQRLMKPALSRREFLQRGAGWAAGLAVLGTSSFLGWDRYSTPRLVRSAFAHVEEESSLRGVLTPWEPVRLALGLAPNSSLPAHLQLCKQCQVEGHPVWHLSSYLDQLGFVQTLVFQDQIPAPGTRKGHWQAGYWTFLPRARPVLLLSTNRTALTFWQREWLPA